MKTLNGTISKKPVKYLPSNSIINVFCKLIYIRDIKDKKYVLYPYQNLVTIDAFSLLEQF